MGDGCKKTKTRAQLIAIGEQRLAVDNDPTRGCTTFNGTKNMRLYKGERLPDGSIVTYKKNKADDFYHKCLAEDEDNEDPFTIWATSYGAKHDCFNLDKLARAASKYFGTTTVDMFKNCIKGDVWKAVKKAIEGMCVRVCTVIKSSVSHLTQPLVNFVFSF